MTMTNPQVLSRRIEEYVVIDRCVFGISSMTIPLSFEDLAN
jgi:hypothetical protein